MVAALDVVNVLATIGSVLIYLSPCPDYGRIIRHKATGEVAILPIVLMFCNALMWTEYGFLDGSAFPVGAVNGFGVLTTIVFASIFLRFASPRGPIVRMYAIALLVMCVPALYITLSKTGAIDQSDDTVVTVMGYAGDAFTIGMYASPLATMRKVVRTKSVASLPVTMSLVGLYCSSIWAVYAILATDFFILVPNALGAMLSLAQVVLYFKYRNSTVEIVNNGELSIVIDDSLAQAKGVVAVSSPVLNSRGVAIEPVTPTTSYEVLHSAKA